MAQTDVVILGGGPAGSAAAIRCATAGLNVTLLEQARFPRQQVGESLHPIVEPVLEQLGVLNAVRKAGFLRYPGAMVAWDGPEFFDPLLGQSGPASGLQAWRADFDAILLEQARQVGVRVWQPAQATGPVLSGHRIVGVETTRGPVLAKFTIDATGARRVVSDWLGIPADRHGPRRVVWSGLAEGSCAARDDCPALHADETGWTWIARVRESTYAWTYHSFRNRFPAPGWVPPALRDTTPIGRIRKHDVTWRLARQPAGPGYFLVGDAAAVLDPASAKGVFEALVSGILAGELIAATESHAITAPQAAARYNTTTRSWFERDVEQLTEFYRRLSHRNDSHRIRLRRSRCSPGI